VIYVDTDAPRANDGTSWENAYFYLQDGLMFAVADDEIRVAQGVYKPDDFVLSDRPSRGREETFQLINGVTLKGGYMGFGSPDPNARDIKLYDTILSGDLNGDDGPNFANNDENCYHVVTGSGTDATAVLDGFTITRGNADGEDPSWKYGGGGGIYSYYGNPTILNCRIRSNSGRSGGGVKNYYHGPTLINCVISSNRATSCCGGGMSNDTSDPDIINCTFSNNIALSSGSAIYSSNSNPTLTNCIVWGNKSESAVVPSMWQIVQVSFGEPVVTYSCIQDDEPNDDYVYPGMGNIDDNPLFVEPDGVDNVIGTEDEQLRLLRGSPCLDAGENSAVPPSAVTDLDGHPRIANGIVDMGAYEGPDQGFVLSSESVTVPEGQTATFTVALSLDPCGTLDATVAVVSADLDITVASGAVLTFDSSDYHLPQLVTLAAAQDTDYFNSSVLILISGLSFSTAGITATEWDDEAPTVLYVDDDASGANDGTSWHDAFAELQDALSVARAVVQVKEIRVAQGVYRPAGPSGQRDISFGLVAGVSVTGGYAGLGEQDPDARDIGAYETVLSGDLNDDDIEVAEPCDLFNEPTRAENSWHVLTAPKGVDETAVLDGFTITAGNATGGGYPPYERNGGGIDIYYDSNPTVRNCTFIGNSADNDGGGVNGDALTNCKFIGNAAVYGGGAFSRGTLPGGRLTDCEFIGNFAEDGGGLVCHGEVVDCTFIGNSARVWGGGVSGNAALTNCTFTANSAGEAGGALLGCGTLTNCIFSANSAGEIGGAMYSYCYLCDSKVINCTFTGNRAGQLGGAMFLGDESDRKLFNSILWANLAPEGPQIAIEAAYYDGLSVGYCNVQGGKAGIYGYDSKVKWGKGNIDIDPIFADPNGGDYHLQSEAGRWDPNSQSWVIDDVTSSLSILIM
jgi:predicted outer membrane repeat protein